MKGRRVAVGSLVAVAAGVLAACQPAKEPPPPPSGCQVGASADSAAKAAAASEPSSAAAAPEAPAWQSPQLDGVVQARPVVVGSTIVVATENDTLYGLKASDGTELWHKHFAESVPLSYLGNFGVPPENGNLDPMGVTGTPVVDTSTNVVYAVGETMPDTPNGPPDFKIVGVNVTTGAYVLSPTSIVPNPQQPDGMYTQVQLQRPKLALANGRVYASFGGLAGDFGVYNGFVVAANATTGNIDGYFKVAAAPNGSDYWGGPVWGVSGPVVDGQGNVYASTGNGFGTIPDENQTESVIKLSPTAQLLDWFQAPNWCLDNINDLDLGSTGPLQLPNNRLFQIGKQGVGFLLDQSSPGGNDHRTPLASVDLGCPVFGTTYDSSSSSIFAACRTDQTRAAIHQIKVNGTTLSVGWTSSPVEASSPPTVDGSVVWAVAGGSNTLYGFDVGDGHVVAQHPFAKDPSQHFVTPVIMGNLALVTAGNQVVGYAKP